MTPTPFTPGVEGIFFGLPADVYRSAPGVSQSELKAFGEEPTPMHFKDSLTRKRTVTPEMEFGTLMHTAIFEPEKLGTAFYVRPDTYSDGKEEKPWHGGAKWCKEWMAGHKDRTVISKEDFEAIPKILASIKSHPRFSALVDSSQREVSFFKRDEETGLLLKCRCDCVATDESGKTFIGDTKFTFRCGASREEFQRSVETMGYDIQDASYRHITGASHFIFMVAEREAPFASCEYELVGVNERTGEDYRTGGLRKYRALLARYAECVAKDSWPGYADAQTLEPSKYYKSV